MAENPEDLIVTDAELRRQLPALADELGIGGLPDGGMTGQVLQQTATGPAWAPAPTSLPAGGSSGQVVTRQPDGSAAWAAPVKGISSVTQGADASRATVTYTDDTTSTLNLPSGKDGADWSKDQQAKAQGYWIVVSAEAPASATYTTADGVTVPVIWQQPITRAVPVLPQTPAFSRASSSLSVPDLVGVVYRLTGWSKDGGATWTTVSKDLVGGAVTDVKAATGQELPVTVRVEAFAKPGYTLPSAYKWTFDYPDPNATVVLTSMTFPVDGNIAGTSTDAALGGTAKAIEASGTAPVVTNGALTGGQMRLAYASVQNFEAEFDVAVLDAATLGDNGFNFLLGGALSSNLHYTGARIQARRQDTGLSRTFDGDVQIRYGSLGTKMAGHWKVNLTGNTFRVTSPDGTISDFSLTKATAGTNFRGGWCYISVDAGASVDNFILKQVGY